MAKGLHKIVNLCHDYCLEWDIKLNAKKARCQCFSKGAIPCYSLKHNGESISWVDKWEYLGLMLQMTR